jgi:SAM-dependent methyltransferase
MLQMLRRVRNNPKRVLPGIENDPNLITRDAVLRRLRRRLTLDHFGELMFSMPQEKFPKLSRLLPSMASREVQLNWTGQTDHHLLRASLRFAHSVGAHYMKFLNRPLHDTLILDYGCGYGRLARLMYYFSAPDRVFGVDPWDESIRLCHQHGLTTQFAQSAYLPETLPVPRNDFGLIYAFSVFTHLSKRATLAALAALRKHIADDGMLVITVRPLAYWDKHEAPPEIRAALKHAHQAEGFAFIPHIRLDVDGDITYGDSGITTEWLADNASDWQLLGTDHLPQDPNQVLLFLRPTAARRA